MKDNLKSGNEKVKSSDTSCKQCIKLWDWVVRVKDLIKVNNNTCK